MLYHKIISYNVISEKGNVVKTVTCNEMIKENQLQNFVEQKTKEHNCFTVDLAVKIIKNPNIEEIENLNKYK
jgi:hypothetical protein